MSRVPEYGNLGGSRAVFRGLPWLTLPPPFAHKRGRPGARHQLTVLTSYGLTTTSEPLGLRCVGRGSVPSGRGADCKSAVFRLRRFESFFPHQPSLAQRAKAATPKPGGAKAGRCAASYGSASHEPRSRSGAKAAAPKPGGAQAGCCRELRLGKPPTPNSPAAATSALRYLCTFENTVSSASPVGCQVRPATTFCATSQRAPLIPPDFCHHLIAFQNPTGENDVAVGTVKWFNATKGYGFIQPDTGGKDVFVHISAVEKAGLSSLNEGAKVSYEVTSNRGKNLPESQGRLTPTRIVLTRTCVRRDHIGMAWRFRSAGVLHV